MSGDKSNIDSLNDSGKELPSTFSPAQIENRLYEKWSNA